MRLRIELGRFVFDSALGLKKPHKSIDASLAAIRGTPRVLGVHVMDDRREYEIEQAEIRAREREAHSRRFGLPGSEGSGS